MHSKLIFIHAYSPLHAGTGQGIGVVDLPIARERATHLPYLPGSSLKGSLRASCGDEALRKKLFGPDTANASEHAGAVQFSDQSLLLLPVRSLAGTVAYATCPYLLNRFRRDAASCESAVPEAPMPFDGQHLIVCNETLLGVSSAKAVLEDLDFDLQGQPLADAWADFLAQRLFADATARVHFKKRFAILPDDAFNFLAEHATEVVARIAMDEQTKTVRNGNLWYEENLPAESVLYGLVLAESVQLGKGGQVYESRAAMAELSPLLQQNQLLQLGGKATVGRGICRLVEV